jgi:membrane-associated phospholipid phosphatase
LVTLALGAYVAQRAPIRIDVEAVALRGAGVPLAVFFTRLGRWPVLLALGFAAGVAAWQLHAGFAAVVTLMVAQLVSQGVNALLKHAFHRTRPDHWLHRLEPDLSYPSGHSVSAVVFFAGLAILAWHAPLPSPIAAAVVVALALCAAGIPWSRLALGAHYPTDVIGGLFFGAAALCVAFAVIARTYAATVPR